MQAISYQAFKHFYEYSHEKLRHRDIVHTFHFKDFGMINLHYVIRICQKIYNRGRITVNVWRLVRNSLHQTLQLKSVPPLSRFIICNVDMIMNHLLIVEKIFPLYLLFLNFLNMNLRR